MKKNSFAVVMQLFAWYLVLVPLVCATPTMLWEDFDDGNGNGAFDPAFIHTFGAHPDFGTGYLDWELREGVPGSPYLWVGAGTQDYITFILEPGQYVSHASVSHPEYNGAISFIGRDGRTDISYPGWLSYDWATTEADISTIGPIQGIILSGDTVFDDIRIVVVPEPATWLLFVTGMVVILSRRNHRAFKSIETNE